MTQRHIRPLMSLARPYKLSTLQIAKALSYSAASIETFKTEAILIDRFGSIEAVKNLLCAYSQKGGIEQDNNLILNTYRLSFARHVLLLTINEISATYGYSVSAWRLFEGNRRELQKRITEHLEDSVMLTAMDIGMLPPDFGE